MSSIAYEDTRLGIGWGQDRSLVAELVDAVNTLVVITAKANGGKKSLKVKPVSRPKMKRRNTGKKVSAFERIAGPFAAALKASKTTPSQIDLEKQD